jgi:shikimate kinase
MTGMPIFIAGVSCVGKTTVGALLAGLLGSAFFDLDAEIERFFGAPIERVQRRYLAMSDFRRAASQVLRLVLDRADDGPCVIALPPSGLLGSYWHVVRTVRDAMIIVLHDSSDHILERMTFYDADSRLVEKVLTQSEKQLYRREIERDIAWLERSFRRARVCVDVAGDRPDAVARRLWDVLGQCGICVRVGAPQGGEPASDSGP